MVRCPLKRIFHNSRSVEAESSSPDWTLRRNSIRICSSAQRRSASEVDGVDGTWERRRSALERAGTTRSAQTGPEDEGEAVGSGAGWAPGTGRDISATRHFLYQEAITMELLYSL